MTSKKAFLLFKAIVSFFYDKLVKLIEKNIHLLNYILSSYSKKKTSLLLY